jgi:ABC-type phosphonate transport system ATPase subunit
LDNPRTHIVHSERAASSSDVRQDLDPGLAEVDPDRERPTHVVCANDLVEHGLTEQVFQSPREPETQSYVTGHFG